MERPQVSDEQRRFCLYACRGTRFISDYAPDRRDFFRQYTSIYHERSEGHLVEVTRWTPWMFREYANMRRRLMVPWFNEPWFTAYRFAHFVYLSEASPGQVAYTENPLKGEADRQTVTRPGRYLTKFFSDVLSAAEIEQWVAEASVMAETTALTITQDADEIEEVYRNGPNSCMSHSLCDYESPVHPVRVYAGPDLALAYTGTRGYASGRAIIWPDKKVYSTIYGDLSRMRLLLEAAGYTRGSLEGARIRRIEADDWGSGVFVMPYVDGVHSARVEGDFIVLGGGDLDTDRTDGLSGNQGGECECCGERMDDESAYYVRVNQYDSENWCDGCADQTFICDYSGDRFSDCVDYSTVRTSEYDTVTVADHYLDRYGAIFVDSLGEYVRDDMTFTCEDCEDVFADWQLHDTHEAHCSTCGDAKEVTDDDATPGADTSCDQALTTGVCPVDGMVQLSDGSIQRILQHDPSDDTVLLDNHTWYFRRDGQRYWSGRRRGSPYPYTDVRRIVSPVTLRCLNSGGAALEEAAALEIAA